jgi:hypothetical protein
MLFLVTLLCGVYFVALSWPSLRVTAETTAPSQWTWQPGPDLTFPRYAHTATLLPDGRVVVIGGITDVNNATRLNSAEIYDPATNTWTLAQGGSSAFRNQHTATLLKDGRILVIGGDANFGGVVNSAEIFDPATGQFTPVASPGPMAQHTAVALNDGSVLVFGGYAGYTGSSPDYILYAMRYTVSNDTWTFAGQTDLYEPMGTILGDGQVIAVARGLGGARLYNPTTNSWTIAPNLPAVNWDNFWGVSLTPLNGNAYFAGYGESVTYSGGWSGVSSLLRNRSVHAATAVGNGVMLIGGIDANYNKFTEAEIGGVSAGHLGVARTWHTATTLKDGRVLVVGGLGQGVTVLRSVEIGEPSGFATATATPTFTVTPTPTRTPTPTLTPTPTATPRTDGVIAGRVWVDEGAWAVQDGEPGLAGIEVRLFTNQGGHLVDDTITNADGRYAFTNLAAAPGIVYTIYTYAPPRHAFVTDNVGNDDAIDSDVDYSQPVDSDENGIWVGSMTVSMDGTNLVQSHWDAGMHSNSMSGRIWWDWNNGILHGPNGIQEAGEPGFEGVEVMIHSGDPPNGAIVRTVTTDANGIFTATNLIPGRYWAATLFASNPASINSPANQGSDDTIDSDATFGNPGCYPDPNCPLYTPAITLPTNGAGLRQDFGIVPRRYFELYAIEWWPTENGQIKQEYMSVAVPVEMFWTQGDQGKPRSERHLARLSVQQPRQLYHLAEGTVRFVWSKPSGYLILPRRGYTDTEADPSTGSTGQIPIPVLSHPYGLWQRSEVFYYKPGASGSATLNGGGSVNTGSVQRSSGATRGVSLVVPPGAVTETVTLHLTDLAASVVITGAGWPRGYAPTDYGFLWDVSIGDVQQGVFDLAQPATVTVEGIDDAITGDLLFYWDSSVGAWISPPQACGLQQATHTASITAPICRSGRYGVFAPATEIFLPTVVR